jgi:aminoglycoside phosphotransferase (APT) family kinase protein
MASPKIYLPGPVTNIAINQLLLSVSLPRSISIVSPKVTAEYHSIYLITIPSNPSTPHTKLVLRISGHHLPRIKTENEVAVMTWVKQNTSIPIPDLVAYDSSTANAIGHEYTLLSLAEGTTLSEKYQSLTESQTNSLLDQLADYLVQLHSHPWNAIGGLRTTDAETIVLDRIVDETFWQAPEVNELWPEGQSIDTLNIRGPYITYVDLVSAQIKTYIHLIQAHTSLTAMRSTIPRLEAFVKTLPKHNELLNNVRLRLAHKDLHFGNILYDFESSRVTAILDWEFSGVVPFPLWNPRRSFLWNTSGDESSRAEKQRLFSLFEERCKLRGLEFLEDAAFASPLQESMQTVVDYLRAITEVGPRGQKADVVEGWKKVVLDNIEKFGC